MSSLSPLLLSLILLLFLNVISAQYDSVHPRRSVAGDMAGSANARAQISAPAAHGGPVDNKIAGPKAEAGPNKRKAGLLAPDVVNSPPNALNNASINTNKVTVLKVLCTVDPLLQAGGQSINDAPKEDISGPLRANSSGRRKDDGKSDAGINNEPGISKGSRISNPGQVPEDVEDMVAKKLSAITSLYNSTDELVQNLNMEFNGLAHVAEDNNNTLKYVFSLIEYFNLELMRIYSELNGNSYDEAFQKALANVRKLKNANAVQLAAPVRSAGSIFRSIIDTQVELVQAACSKKTPNCAKIYSKRVKKEKNYCPNIIYHAYVFSSILSTNEESVKSPQVTEKIVDNILSNQQNRLRRSNGKSTSKSGRNEKRNAKSHADLHNNARPKRADSEENKPVLPIPQVLGGVADTVKNVAADRKYIVKTVDSVAQRIAEVPKSVIGKVDSILGLRKRRKRNVGGIPNVKKNINGVDPNGKQNMNADDANAKKSVNMLASKAISDNSITNAAKPALKDSDNNTTDNEEIEPIQTTTEKDNCPSKAELGKLFDYTLEKIELSLDKNKILLQHRATVFALVTKYQKENKLTCVDIDRKPSLDEPLN